MENYKFADYKSKIWKAIEDKEKAGFFGEGKEVAIVDAFAILTLQGDLNGVDFDKRYIPLVVVVDQETGQVYHFALKSLVPEIELV